MQSEYFFFSGPEQTTEFDMQSAAYFSAAETVEIRCGTGEDGTVRVHDVKIDALSAGSVVASTAP
jgi:hypothetical protein